MAAQTATPTAGCLDIVALLCPSLPMHIGANHACGFEPERLERSRSGLGTRRQLKGEGQDKDGEKLTWFRHRSSSDLGLPHVFGNRFAARVNVQFGVDMFY